MNKRNSTFNPLKREESDLLGPNYLVGAFWARTQEKRVTYREISKKTKMKQITVQVNTTTGSTFDITINEEGHVDELRWQIARKLQTPRDRLTLIHRER